MGILKSLNKTFKNWTDPGRKEKERALRRTGLADKYTASDFSSARDVRRTYEKMKDLRREKKTKLRKLHSAKMKSRRKRFEEKEEELDDEIISLLQALKAIPELLTPTDEPTAPGASRQALASAGFLPPGLLGAASAVEAAEKATAKAEAHYRMNPGSITGHEVLSKLNEELFYTIQGTFHLYREEKRHMRCSQSVELKMRDLVQDITRIESAFRATPSNAIVLEYEAAVNKFGALFEECSREFDKSTKSTSEPSRRGHSKTDASTQRALKTAEKALAETNELLRKEPDLDTAAEKTKLRSKIIELQGERLNQYVELFDKCNQRLVESQLNPLLENIGHRMEECDANPKDCNVDSLVSLVNLLGRIVNQCSGNHGASKDRNSSDPAKGSEKKADAKAATKAAERESESKKTGRSNELFSTTEKNFKIFLSQHDSLKRRCSKENRGQLQRLFRIMNESRYEYSEKSNPADLANFVSAVENYGQLVETCKKEDAEKSHSASEGKKAGSDHLEQLKEMTKSFLADLDRTLNLVIEEFNLLKDQQNAKTYFNDVLLKNRDEAVSKLTPESIDQFQMSIHEFARIVKASLAQEQASVGTAPFTADSERQAKLAQRKADLLADFQAKLERSHPDHKATFAAADKDHAVKIHIDPTAGYAPEVFPPQSRSFEQPRQAKLAQRKADLLADFQADEDTRNRSRTKTIAATDNHHAIEIPIHQAAGIEIGAPAAVFPPPSPRSPSLNTRLTDVMKSTVADLSSRIQANADARAQEIVDARAAHQAEEDTWKKRQAENDAKIAAIEAATARRRAATDASRKAKEEATSKGTESSWFNLWGAGTRRKVARRRTRRK